MGTEMEPVSSSTGMLCKISVVVLIFLLNNWVKHFVSPLIQKSRGEITSEEQKKMLSRQVGRAFYISRVSNLLDPNLSVRFPGLNLAPSSLVAKGCQDVIGSIPSVFLDKKC